VASLSAWALDPDLAYLNHGSFGAVPRAVMEYRAALLDRIELDSVRFFAFDLPDLLTDAREKAAGFIGADPDGFAFVSNATAGVNTALRAAPIGPGEEILVTDHGYEACTLAAEHVAARRGATVRLAEIPVPVGDPDEVRAAIVDAVTPSTTWAVIDHVTSPSGLVWPITDIVRDLMDRGVRVIVDGAHAPGQVPLRVSELGAAAYAGNWHKWTCAPKGSGFLWVAADWREEVRPLVISHGAGHRGEEGRRFRATFDWTGTSDPTPYLSVPAALETVGAMLRGGWDAVMERNRATVLDMRDRIVEETGLAVVGPDVMVGSMVSFVVPSERRPAGPAADVATDLVRHLLDDHGVVVGAGTRRGTDEVYVRISAHLHTDPGWAGRFVSAFGEVSPGAGA
jgi:isopenicillin-N epimerase